jgi:hypothetical protein
MHKEPRIAFMRGIRIMALQNIDDNMIPWPDAASPKAYFS